MDDGRLRRRASLNTLERFIPRGLTIDDAFLPNEILDFKFVPLFLVEHLIITFDPNGPKHNAPKKMPNVIPCFVFLTNAMSKDAILPVELMDRVLSSATKVKQNLERPFPRSSGLDAVPKHVLERFLSVGEAIGALCRDVGRNLSPPVVHRDCLVPD